MVQPDHWPPLLSERVEQWPDLNILLQYVEPHKKRELAARSLLWIDWINLPWQLSEQHVLGSTGALVVGRADSLATECGEPSLYSMHRCRLNDA